MIVRIVVVDPNPKCSENDVLVFQVPEKSRQQEILTELLSEAGYDFVEIPVERKPRAPRPPKMSEEDL